MGPPALRNPTNSKAQHSTAQHEQDTTAQHNRAQHSTGRPNNACFIHQHQALVIKQAANKHVPSETATLQSCRNTANHSIHVLLLVVS
jgi:hypothetical protein